jgi:MoaA/NifB/PqqE/SkfB family radical SAM enzyme
MSIATRILEQARLRPAPGKPVQVHLSVTDRCFLPCLHCDIYKNEAEDLPEETWAGAIDGLARWLGPAAMNFVGGEPLLRKDLERLMARATRLGFTVTFNTNGWLLTEKRAHALAEAGVSIAYVSMDGIRAATVEHSRGRPGALRKVFEACDLLDRVPNPRVVIACVLNGTNAAEIPALIAWVKARGYQLVVQPLYQNFGAVAHDPGWWRRSPLWPHDLGAIDAAIDALADERRGDCQVCNPVEQLEAFRGYFRDPSAYNGQVCKAGHSDIAFDPAGNVRLCYFLEPIGNLNDGRSLPAVWNAVATMRRRYEVHRCTRSCNLLNCNFERPD